MIQADPDTRKGTMVGLVRLKNVAEILWQFYTFYTNFWETLPNCVRGEGAPASSPILNAMGEDDRAVHVFDAVHIF